MARPTDQQYKKKWKSITNVLKNSNNLKVSRIAQAGSRAKKRHRPDSDMDVIFAASGDPERKSFYTKLKKTLEGNFKYEKVYEGSNKNVVHIDFRNGAKFDIVLLTEKKFDEQHGKDVEYRRKNL